MSSIRRIVKLNQKGNAFIEFSIILPFLLLLLVGLIDLCILLDEQLTLVTSVEKRPACSRVGGIRGNVFRDYERRRFSN